MNHPHIACLLWELGRHLRDNAVLKSQVLGQMRCLASLGARVSILCSDPSPSEFKAGLGRRLESEGFEVTPVQKRGWRNFPSLIEFKRQVALLDQRAGIDFIYIRNFWNMLAVPELRAKVVFDLRGANKEETQLSAQKRNGPIEKAKRKIYSYFEKQAIARADHLQCVSQGLKSYIYDRFQRSDAAVVNSCIEKEKFKNCRLDRDRIRRSLGLKPGDIVFAFVGGLDSYQELDFTFALWAKIAGFVPNARFVVYTSQKANDMLRDKCSGYGISSNRIIITSVEYNNIPEYIAATDFGFLMRRNTVLNNVASPVKFAEYLGAGLGVVTSPGIGGVSKFVEDNNVGCLVTFGDIEGGTKVVLEFVEEFKKGPSMFAQRIQDIGLRNFCWESYHHYFTRRYFSSQDGIRL